MSEHCGRILPPSGRGRRSSFEGLFTACASVFANANVDSLAADLLQKLMRHQAAVATRRYINAAEHMKRAGTADKSHVPDVLRVAAVS